MKTLTRPVVLAAAVVAVLSATPAASKPERHFTSTLGFSLNYPSDWQGGEKGYERFWASKGPSAPKTVPLSRGQAVVSTWELNSPSEIERLIAQIDSDDILVLKQTSQNRRGKGCYEIRRVSSLFELGPGSRTEHIAPLYERNVHFFCTVGNRAFVTMLRYSRSDPAGALHEAAARKMMESLQVETAD